MVCEDADDDDDDDCCNVHNNNIIEQLGETQLTNKNQKDDNKSYIKPKSDVNMNYS